MSSLVLHSAVMIHSGRSERGADHERLEVIEAGFGILVGSDYHAIVHGVRSLTAGGVPRLLHRPNPLGRGDSGNFDTLAWLRVR